MVALQECRLGAGPRCRGCTFHVDLRIHGHFAAAGFNAQGNLPTIPERSSALAGDAAAVKQDSAGTNDVTGQDFDISDERVVADHTVGKRASVNSGRKLKPFGQRHLASEATENHVALKAGMLNPAPIKTLDNEHPRPVG